MCKLSKICIESNIYIVNFMKISSSVYLLQNIKIEKYGKKNLMEFQCNAYNNGLNYV
ncbi:hypothetical protein C2G38_299522 [Gigaspora rosea]|uniref:Uncharacterized protein n=1 Tax=Gigaspora rosea TaxID=44941 RepID=A0A397VUL1_9GLOM|nr:hypothetical protein C2G38_299522 [Gigaspora rosea]